MPFAVTNEGGFLLARFHGVVTPAELQQANDELEAFEDSMPETIGRIADLASVAWLAGNANE